MKLPTSLVRALAAGVVSFATGGDIAAQTNALADPTRPPSVDAQAASRENSVQAHVLQSVLIAPGRSNAVIDGQTVRIGSRVGDAKVVKIDATGVTLDSGGKMELLKLIPFAKQDDPGRSRRPTSEKRAK